MSGIFRAYCSLRNEMGTLVPEVFLEFSLRERAAKRRASLRSEDVDENNLLKGTYSFVFGSPESFLQNEKWRNMLRSNVYQDRTFAIVADEVHVVPKW